MFGLIHRGELDPTTENELENLVSKSKSHILREHKDDGTHDVITATSVEIAEDLTVTGSGTIGNGLNVTGSITATDSPAEVEIGNVGTSAGSVGRIGPGIELRSTADSTVKWDLVAEKSGGDHLLHVLDRHSGSESPLRVHYDNAATKYHVSPNGVTNALIPVTLGDVFQSFGTGRWSVVYAGTLDASGVQFPATQVDSADANCLDDYEEGSWTPVLGGSGGTSGQTYTTQVGRYVKIGRLVTCQFTLTLSNKGTITGTCELQGLPFTAENVSSLFSVGSLQFNVLATNWVNVIVVAIGNSKKALVRGNTAAATGNATDLVTADIANTTQLVGTLTYRTAND